MLKITRRMPGQKKCKDIVILQRSEGYVLYQQTTYLYAFYSGKSQVKPLKALFLQFYGINLTCFHLGATLACGTGACAVVVAAVLEGRTERVRILSKKEVEQLCSFSYSSI